MDDDDAKHLLLDVRRRVLEVYPFKDGDAVDLRYCMAFGLIAGIVTEALLAKRSNRKANFVIEVKERA